MASKTRETAVADRLVLQKLGISNVTDGSRQSGIEFFQVSTFHDTIVVSETRHAELGNTKSDGADEFSSPVVALRVPSLPGHIVLVGGTAPTYLRVLLCDLSGHAMTLRVHPTGDSEWIGLSHPILPSFLSAIIPEGEAYYGRLEGNRSEVHGWETFRLEPLAEAATAGRLRLIGERLDTLFARPITIETIEQAIRDGQVDGTPEVLDAVLPFLSTQQIESFAKKLLSDESLCAQLARQLPGDPWASEGIPSLRQWLALREARPNTLPKARYECSAIFGILGRTGLQGDIASFSQACAHALRRAVLPQRGAAILACVRNEGIYLLEWIAYHRAIGIEWFFLYSNDNDDRSDSVLKLLAEYGIITWIENPIDLGQAAQHKAYGHALSVMPDILDFSWVQVLDGDEFVAMNPKYYNNINEYLKWTRTRAVDSISLNWRFIASEPLHGGEEVLFTTPLTERTRQFVRPDVVGEAGGRLVKSLFRPACAIQSQAHYPLTSTRYAITMCLADGSPHEWRSPPGGQPASACFADHHRDDKIGIYHYFHKSAEEWMWKSARNRGDNPASVGIALRNFVDGWIGNFMSQVDPSMRAGEESWVAARMSAMHAELHSLKALPGMQTALANLHAAYRHKSALIRQALQDEKIREKLSDDNQKFLDLVGVP